MTIQLHPSPQEVSFGDETMLHRLQEARWSSAESLANDQVNKVVKNLDRIENPITGLLTDRSFNGIYIGLDACANEFMAYEAAGVDIFGIIQNNASDTNISSRSFVGGAVSLSFKMDSGTLLYKWETTEALDQDEESAVRTAYDEEVSSKVIERYSKSSIYRLIRESLAGKEGTLVSEFTLSDLDMLEDGLASASFLTDIGYPGADSTFRDKVVRKHQTLPDYINEILYAQSGGHDQSEDADYMRKSWRTDGVQKTLFFDKRTGRASYSVEATPEMLYVETASKSQEQSLPFVDTHCAKELCSLLAGQGLMFSPAIQEIILTPGAADSYGSVYTQMSREIAKWVNQPQRTAVRNLFVPYDAEFSDVHLFERYNPMLEYNDKVTDYGILEEAIDQQEKYVRDRLMSVSVDGMSEPTRVLVGLVQQVLTRSDESALNVTEHAISIRKGACFDVAGYYLEGVDMPRQLEGVAIEQVNGTTLLKKTYGGKTHMLTAPIKFNGVTLPKGSLMTRETDDGRWAFLRLSPFTFDDSSDRLATGSELQKAVRSIRAGELLGQLTMSEIVAKARARTR